MQALLILITLLMTTAAYAQSSPTGAGSRCRGGSRRCFEREVLTTCQTPLVILRESGVSSTLRRLASIATALEYWIPAFAGMTTEGEDDPSPSLNNRHMPRDIA